VRVTPQTRSLLIAVQLCFGVFPWLGKIAMQGFEPRAVLVWRLFVGAAVLMGLALFRHGRAVWPGGRDLGALFGLSLLGITINQLFFLEGLSRSTAVNAGLIMTVIPVATVGLGALLGHGRPGTRQLVGIGLSVVGVAWLFLQRGAEIGSDSLLGDALMTINALSYSAYLVFARPLVLRLPQAVVIGWVFVFGALTAPWFSLGSEWVPGSANSAQWMALGGILLFPTVLAYLGNMISLKRAGANLTAAYVMLQPLIAALLGIGLLGERPEPGLAVTAVCVLAGLWFVSTPGRSKPTGPHSDGVSARTQCSDSSVSPT
jgi:drug/metabolite transporter (DMT)-like permease